MWGIRLLHHNYIVIIQDQGPHQRSSCMHHKSPLIPKCHYNCMHDACIVMQTASNCHAYMQTEMCNCMLYQLHTLYSYLHHV